jgi:D-serine dehydratase
MIVGVPPEVRAGVPTVWRNPALKPAADVLPTLPLQRGDIEAAQARWRRFAPLLARLFPELAAAGGRIDSALLEIQGKFAAAVLGREGPLLIKADHDLPLTGSIKARGGVYEVLWYAEQVAAEIGLPADYAALGDASWRERFARHTVVVGSTGNLGFSVGVMARALGFAAEVHMSSDARTWKKDRLRGLGVDVVEHAADYTVAVAAARASAAQRSHCHFVDDETSMHLFLGYACGAFDLEEQLVRRGIGVDAEHPLWVFLPCGVGGAPGGITFGLKHAFGDAVRCVFVEPVESPCMLVQLASDAAESVSVYDFGRTNQTVQDGLAVAAASLFAASMVQSLIEGIVTVGDSESLDWVRLAWRDMELRVEPSAASAMAAAQRWMAVGAPIDCTPTALVWTTGGGLLPPLVFDAFLDER